MRFVLPAVALAVICGTLPATAEVPGGMYTAQNAILCLSRDNVGTANMPKVSRSQTVLRAMGCLRSESGIPIRLLDPKAGEGPVKIRFYPAGMSAGIDLWALPSSFTDGERARLEADQRRAGS
jgi:hypothetical protein